MEMKISYRLGANSDTKALPVSSLNGQVSVFKQEGAGSACLLDGTLLPRGHHQ